MHKIRIRMHQRIGFGEGLREQQYSDSPATKILNTKFCTQLVALNRMIATVPEAQTIQKAQKFVEAVFEYVCDFDEAKLFRKRK